MTSRVIVPRLRNMLAAAAGILAATGVMITPQTSAQSASTATPKFEVASIRLATNCEGGGRDPSGSRSKWSPGRLTLECQTVDHLIRDAYLLYADGKPWPVPVPGGLRVPPISARLLDQPIKGGPAWVGSDRYTIEAKTEGTPREELTVGPMLQVLLEDRLKLKIRRGTREVPVYELTVTKGGPKLAAAQEGSCIPVDWDHPLPPPSQGQPLPRLCGPFLTPARNGIATYHQTIGGLCRLLSATLDRDVIDKTEITGVFDIYLDIDVHALVADLSPEAADGGPGTVGDGAAMFGAFRVALSNLGLKLKPAKGSGEFLVIDHVERPSEN
jgi:uncharacterized protein (TIGR03435 family)